MTFLRWNAAVQQCAIGRLHRGLAISTNDAQPGVCGVAHRPHEGVPGLCDPLAEDIGAPVGVAFLDLRRRKEEYRSRARETLAAAQVVPVRSADGATVLELQGEMRMGGRTNRDASAHVDVDARYVRRQRRNIVVRQHFVVAAEAAGE